jgi:hypothetical protein
VFSYAVQVSPATQEYRSVASCNENGHYLLFDLDLKSKREKMNISMNANTDSRNAKALEDAWGETLGTSKLFSDSLLVEEEDNVLRLDSQNKVENKDTGAITYSRAFSREQAVEDITLLKTMESVENATQ